MPTYAEKKWGDCSKAVAYSLNFVQMCYNDSMSWTDYFTSKCPHYDDLSIQSKDFVYPKASFSKKDYYILDTLDYGVSKKLRDDMILFGVDNSCFRPIHYSRDYNTILGYSISPSNVLPPVYELNDSKRISRCEICKLYSYEFEDDAMYFEAYNGLGYPVYISQTALDNLGLIARTFENDGIIISLELYNYLIEKYPRLECRPVFLGNLKTDDREYLRLHKKRVIPC